MRQWIVFKKEYFFLLLIAAVVMVIYSPGLSGPFVFDDFPTFVHNQQFQVSDLSFNSISQALSSSKTGLTSRPVALFSLLINYHYFGLNPFSYKLTNVFIHLINGFILFSALKIFFELYRLNKNDFLSEKKIAGIITAIWLFHPLNVTSVLYVVQRMASLSCTFMLLAFYAYLLIRKKQLHGRNESVWQYFLLFISLILGFLAKDNAIIILGIIFITELIFFNGKSNQIISQRLLKLSINFGWLCCVFLAILIFW